MGPKRPAKKRKRVYFHGELPPMDLDIGGQYPLEARSDAVELQPHERQRGWALCLPSLERHLAERLEQEIDRLGGSAAQIFDEAVRPEYDYLTGRFWLEGTYDFLLYVEPAAAHTSSARAD